MRTPVRSTSGIWALVALASTLVLSACEVTTNTISRDVSATGAAITHAANEAKQGL
jgi:predicted small secreted protein